MTELYSIEPFATDHLNPYGLVFCYRCDEETDAQEEFGEDEDLEDPDLPQDGPETQVLGLPSDLEWEDGTGDPILIRAALHQ